MAGQEAGFAFEPQQADGFEKAQGAQSIDIGGIFRRLERDLHMRLCAEIVDFVGGKVADESGQPRAIGQVALVEHYGWRARLGEVVNTAAIGERTAPLDTVDMVAFLQQKFGKIGAILAGNPGDEGRFACAHGVFPPESIARSIDHSAAWLVVPSATLAGRPTLK